MPQLRESTEWYPLVERTGLNFSAAVLPKLMAAFVAEATCVVQLGAYVVEAGSMQHAPPPACSPRATANARRRLRELRVAALCRLLGRGGALVANVRSRQLGCACGVHA